MRRELLFVLALSGCFSPDLSKVVYRCDPATPCPPTDWQGASLACEGGLCVAPSGTSGGTDMPAPDRWQLAYRTTAPLWAISGWDKNSVFAVGGNSQALRWDGSNWITEPILGMNTHQFFALSVTSPTEVWAVSPTAGLFRRTATMWMAPTFYRDLRALGCRVYNAQAECIAGGTGMYRWIFTNGSGSTFITDSTKFYGAFGRLSGNALVLVGENSKIVRSVTAVMGMDTVAGPATTFRGVWGASDAQMWAVGDGGALATSAGTNWTISTPFPVSENLKGIGGTSATDLWAVGDAGAIYHYDGAAWAKQRADGAQGYNLTSVWAADPTAVWVVGEKAGAEGAVFTLRP